MVNRILLFLAVLISASVRGQDYYKIFEVRYDYSPSNPYTYNASNKADVAETGTTLSLPLMRKNNDAWLLGLGFNTMELNPHYAEEVPAGDTIFAHNHLYYRYRVQAGYNKKFGEKSGLVAIAMLRLSSDMVEVEADHYQYGGLLLYSNRRNDKLELKYGRYVNTEFFSLFVIPLFGLDWKINSRLRAYGVLPSYMILEQMLGNGFRGGLIFEAPNESYRVSDKNVKSISGSQSVSTYVQNYKNVLFAYAECYFTESIVFQLRVGYTVFRRIRLYESDETSAFNIYGIDFGGRRIPIYDVPAYRKFSDGPVINVNFSYRFKL